MASPVTMGLMAVSSGFRTLGAMNEGRAAQKIANRNAAVSEQNAVIARQNAKAQEESFRREATRRQGSRRAAAGASGLQLTGSPLAVLEDAAREEELDALEIRYQGTLQTQSYQNQAGTQRFEGRAAKSQSISKAGAALLGGGANLWGVHMIATA